MAIQIHSLARRDIKIGKIIKASMQKLLCSITVIILGAFAYHAYTLSNTVRTQDRIIKTLTEVAQIQKTQTPEGEKIKEMDNFQKKIACEKYKDLILDKIKQYNNSQKPELRDSNNAGGPPMYNLYVENNEFKEIFYSPRVNSCLYLEDRKTLIKRGSNAKPNIGDWGVEYESYYLVDALTGKEIDFNNELPSLQIIHRGEVFNSEKEADAIIGKYK